MRSGCFLSNPGQAIPAQIRQAEDRTSEEHTQQNPPGDLEQEDSGDGAEIETTNHQERACIPDSVEERIGKPADELNSWIIGVRLNPAHQDPDDEEQDVDIYGEREQS